MYLFENNNALNGGLNGELYTGNKREPLNLLQISTKNWIFLPWQHLYLTVLGIYIIICVIKSDSWCHVLVRASCLEIIC